MSDAVTVTAPATSSLRPPAAAGIVGIRRSVSSTTRMPIGKLTRKIQCQLSVSVRTPPSSTPMLPPPDATKPKIPIAFARSAGSVKSVIINESATAEATAPEQVAEPPAEQQEAAVRQHVRVHDPGERRLGEAEILADRGQRDVHDRDVEDDHQAAETED